MNFFRLCVLLLVYTASTLCLTNCRHHHSPDPSASDHHEPEILEVRKIWDRAPHNAFTDLVRFEDRWFCTFREGERHVHGQDGTIRVIASEDGENWVSAASLEQEGVDLRDPKLSITPDGRLMIVAGGSVYDGQTFVRRRPRVTFSEDGLSWTPMQPVLADGDWLWRITWHEGQAYGVSYNVDSEDWSLTLYSGGDGISYEPVTTFEIPGRPNETTLRFLPSGEMIAFVRREADSSSSWIGSSLPPYADWTWHETSHRVGGPNFIVLPDGRMWATGRAYLDDNKTVLARFGKDTYEPVLTLPSGGDTSYPGLVWHDGILWMSYYSSHEGKTSIYLATIRLQ